MQFSIKKINEHCTNFSNNVTSTLYKYKNLVKTKYKLLIRHRNYKPIYNCYRSVVGPICQILHNILTLTICTLNQNS